MEARKCDIAEQLYDGFPLPKSSMKTMYAIRRSRKIKGKGTPRRVTGRENAKPLFSSVWDYSKDTTYGPIVKDLENGVMVKGYHMENGRLITENRQCIPYNLIADVVH